VRKAEAGPRSRPVWDAVAARVQALLADSVRWTGGKQRLTATRLYGLLLTEGLHIGVTLVKDAVAEWKRQRREVFVPLTYRPGDLAEVDFFEVLVDLDGTRRKAWLFLMRLMYSGRDFAWVYERQDQISFLDGHVRAFAHFESVPARVAYDNLRRRSYQDSRRRRPHVDAALRGTRFALPPRSLFLPAGRRPR
jgi:transposase